MRTAFVLVSLILAFASSAVAQSKPNIILIVVDDMGWKDLQSYGATVNQSGIVNNVVQKYNYYQTPNMDALFDPTTLYPTRKKGMRFTRAYAAAPVCSASRAALLSGKHPARRHQTANAETDAFANEHDPNNLARRVLYPQASVDYLDATDATTKIIPEFLPKNGANPPVPVYKCASIGKWDVARSTDHETLPEDLDNYPQNRGFTGSWPAAVVPSPAPSPAANYNGNFAGTSQHGVDTHTAASPAPSSSPPNAVKKYYGIYNVPYAPIGKRLSAHMTDEAIAFVDSAKSAPFFLYLNYYLVHSPYETQDTVPTDPNWEPTQIPYAGYHTSYRSMLEQVDTDIGRLLVKLHNLGIENDTIIILTSDNGGRPEYTSMYPLKMDKGKGTLWEPGIRVPLIINWPGVTDKLSQRENCSPVSLLDLFPTIVEMAGGTVPSGYGLDGENLVPILMGQRTAPLHDALYFHYPHHQYVPDGPHMDELATGPCGAIIAQANTGSGVQWHKLLENFSEGTLQLFNLDDDTGETEATSLDVESEPYRSVALSLRQKLTDWRGGIVQALMPRPNPLWREASPNALSTVAITVPIQSPAGNIPIASASPGTSPVPVNIKAITPYSSPSPVPDRVIIKSGPTLISTITRANAVPSPTPLPSPYPSAQAYVWNTSSNPTVGPGTITLQAQSEDDSTSFKGKSAVLNYVVRRPAPAAPGAPSASPGVSQVNLTWADNSADEAAFLVEYMKIGGFGWSRVNLVPANTVSLTVFNLAAGTYNFRVRALNATDPTAPSAWATSASVTIP